MSISFGAILLYNAIAMFIGAFPAGYVIARCMGVQDITRHGSGTIGATNVARVISPYLFFIVLLIDVGKAALCIHIMPKELAPFWIIMLMLLNSHSFLLDGRGGKGVATLLGILCVLAPVAALVFVVVWLLALFYFRSVGIASVIALCCLIFSVYYVVPSVVVGVRIIAAALWSLYRHKEHVKRLQFKETRDVF